MNLKIKCIIMYIKTILKHIKWNWKCIRRGIFITVGGLFIIWLLMFFPKLQVNPYRERLTDNEFVTQVNAYRRTIVQIIGGILVGLYLTWRRIRATEKNALVAHEGQITERFTRAIEQLGNVNLDVRLGGVYALERIAKDSPKDHPQIMEILTAFVREHAPLKEKKDEDKNKSSPSAIKTDIQAVLTVIGRRNVDYDRKYQRIDLSQTNLFQANLVEANLQKACLVGVNLKKAILLGANLKKAILLGANLQEAYLWEANLQEAYLVGVNLKKAYLRKANLHESDLSGANLQEAILIDANMQSVRKWESIIDMTDLNIYGIKMAPEGFVEFAKSKGAVEYGP